MAGEPAPDRREWVSVANVPASIAAVLASPLRLATLHEMQTIYGTEDLHDMLEILMVDVRNKLLAAQKPGR